LDVDHGVEGFLFASELVLGGSAYAIYSTHSHRPEKPKYRLIIPTSRGISPDEYGAVSRKLAEQIGMDYFDKTTFDVQRLMYLPSCSKDATPVLEVYEGDPLNVENVLAEYADCRDPLQWPRHVDDKSGPVLTGKKAQDPREKFGTIGLFCRAYTIEEGIDTFLSDIYSAGSMPNRYTYNHGTSGNGLEIFTDQDLAYSHQDSDPVADGRTYNLFDLVRVHKFSKLDDRVKEFTPDAKKPSHVAMEHFAAALPEVKRLTLSEMQADFDGTEEESDEATEEPESDAWKDDLEIHHKTGLPLSTAGNVELILSHALWRGVLAYDAFGNTEVIRKPLPWRERERPHIDYEPWLGADDKRLQHWFAKTHNLKGSAMIMSAFTEVAHTHKFHPIKEYIESFSWDGQKRLERLFIDYLGAEDTHYVQQVTRKMFLAAISRLYRPGGKFDEMLVLVGPQGAGKSSILAKLGRKWFSDSLRTFENKEAGEHLQAGWIFEIAELSAMKKSEVDEVKAFLSKTEDRYRVAYDRTVSEFPRKCIFFGTTNTRDFLKDETGNRRFWPVEVDPERSKLSHWDHLNESVVGQVWAEVLCLFKAGESLELDKDAKEEALRKQTAHLEIDPREGTIREWLEAPIEEEWGETSDGGKYRNRVCASQIWVECLNKRIGDMTRWDARLICGIMRNVTEWQELKGRLTLPGWGKQTVFNRVKIKN
jgi:predicted P-loop ATPase